jgi:predicted aldo/keto reductase-like oxidoreductase
MGIRQCCSYTATIVLPAAASTYSDILVTVAQSGSNLIVKRKEDLDADGNTITLKLSQEETALLSAVDKFNSAQIQVRCYASEYDAPGSPVWSVDVLPALNDTILPEVTP